jgi:hypothetical protein
MLALERCRLFLPIQDNKDHGLGPRESIRDVMACRTIIYKVPGCSGHGTYIIFAYSLCVSPHA